MQGGPLQVAVRGGRLTPGGNPGARRATCEPQAPLSTSARGSAPSRVLTGRHTAVLHTCGPGLLGERLAQLEGGRQRSSSMTRSAGDSAVPGGRRKGSLCNDGSSQRFGSAPPTFAAEFQAQVGNVPSARQNC